MRKFPFDSMLKSVLNFTPYGIPKVAKKWPEATDSTSGKLLSYLAKFARIETSRRGAVCGGKSAREGRIF
jgi:hypothetical protein